jgi:hypothetical protein
MWNIRRQRIVTSLAVFVASVTVVSLATSLSIATSDAGAQGAKPVVALETSQRYFNPVAVFAHGKYLWVADNSAGPQHRGAVFRIDIATGKSVPIVNPLFDDPVRLFSDGTDLWIVNDYGGPPSNGYATSSLLKLNIATNKLTKVVSRAVMGPSDVTSNGKYLWILNTDGGSQVTRMDIATGAFTTNDSLTTFDEGTITSDKNYVWVGGERLLRISEVTDKIKVIDPKALTSIGTLASDGTHLWIRWGNRHLAEMDIATGAMKSFYNPMFEFNYGLATRGSDVWMTDSYDRTVLQFDATTGTTTEIDSPLYSTPGTSSELFAITSEGKELWVTITCQKLVHGLLAACGTVARITP